VQLDLLQKESSPRAKTRGTIVQHPDKNFEEKSPGAFKTISEAADFLGVPQHVLRFWEGRFTQIKPLKLRGGRRYYRPEDMEILSTIKHLLYKQGYTIKGAKKAFAAQPVPEPPDSSRHGQLTALRQELIGLRETLKPHIF